VDDRRQYPRRIGFGFEHDERNQISAVEERKRFSGFALTPAGCQLSIAQQDVGVLPRLIPYCSRTTIPATLA
jgi:hypothetical protein